MTLLAILDKCVQITVTYGGSVDNNMLAFQISLERPEERKRNEIASEDTNADVSIVSSATTSSDEDVAIMARQDCDDGDDELPAWGSVSPCHRIDVDAIVCNPNGADEVPFPRSQIHSVFVQHWCRRAHVIMKGKAPPAGFGELQTHAALSLVSNLPR